MPRSAARFRYLKLGLMFVGAIGGMMLPLITRELAPVAFVDTDASTAYRAFETLLHGAYGALAGWAIGALAAHLLGER